MGGHPSSTSAQGLSVHFSAERGEQPGASQVAEVRQGQEQPHALSPALTPKRSRVSKRGGGHRGAAPANKREESLTNDASAEAVTRVTSVAPLTPLPATGIAMPTAQVEQGAAPQEPQKQQETPRGARRYRFDRPASTESEQPGTAVQQPRHQQGQQTHRLERTPPLQELPAGTDGSVAAIENGGAHHASGEEEAHSSAVVRIGPEDLPPLEYSELRAATSRRRRRRRPIDAAQGMSPTPFAHESSATPLPDQVAGTGPGVPSSAQQLTNPYSIQSGVTLSQMNQGDGARGPFMGPEPSPARGSIVQPSFRPQYSGNGGQRGGMRSMPPVRHGEWANSPGDVNHLANVITQTVQTQTDRMSAELWRATRGPNNVSVAVPPFPSTERVGVFVDVANLLYSARNLRIALDFGKLLDFLRGNRRLVRAHAYCPTSPQQGEDQMFLQAVQGLGYRITTKNYKTFASGARKADLDLDLCMDVVRLVDGNAVDCIVLVSGDSDFMPMLDYCSDHGVRVEIAAFDEATAATLRQCCDLFVNLSQLEEIRA